MRDRGDAAPGPGAGPAATPGAAGAHRRTGGGRPAAPRADTDQPGAAGARPGPPASAANRASTASPGTSAQAGRTATAGRARPAAPVGDGQGGDAGGAQGRRGRRDGPAAGPGGPPGRRARPPWYEIAQSNRTAVGRRHCGHLEPLVHREWAENAVPSPEIVRAIDRLAELPQLIKSKLAAGLDAIYVGMGGVPNLDDMGRLAGVPLPSGRATWDACAGAYGERKIIVGSRPSPSPDVMCHEIGHALDDIDGIDDQWQSDSAEFQALYDQCLPHMVSAFHQQPGLLGRREFFADAFAAIASRQRPALVEMLGGDTRTALNVMLYFNVRYGI